LQTTQFILDHIDYAKELDRIKHFILEGKADGLNLKSTNRWSTFGQWLAHNFSA